MATEVYRKKIDENTTLVVEQIDDTYVWCLFGHTKDGLYWESEDFEASSLEEAISDAEDYLAEWEQEYPGE